MPFVKGQSGNPGGRIRSHRREVIDAMLAELKKKTILGDPVTNAQRVAQTAVKEAIHGDVHWARLLMEYVYGKPVQPVEVEVLEYATKVASILGADPAEIISLAERRKAG
jgi:hypothetical protein